MPQRAFKTCFETDFFTLEEKSSETDKPYYRYNSNSSSISVVLDAEDNLIFVQQYRENLETYTLEFPAGAIELGETPTEAIIREVYEEAGLRVKAKYLGEGFLLMDRCKNPDHLFFAFESLHSPEKDQTKSEFPVVKVPRLSFATRLVNGEFKQLGALSIIALMDYIFDIRFLEDSRSSLSEKGLLK